MTLLTKSNNKLQKSLGYGWRSFGLHLAPYKLSGTNLCTSASKGCAESCLNKSGHGQSGRVQEARLRKTMFFIEHREEFLAQLYKEISSKVNTSKKMGEKVCFRLNLTSDVLWEQVKYQGKSFMEHFPNVAWYDYTKHFKRMNEYLDGKLPKNYHLTFSRSENNDKHTRSIMNRGGSVAVVFHKSLPKTYLRKKIIDGDISDLRFLDKKGVVIGLVSKGVGKKDKSGFVLSNHIKNK